MPSRVRVVIGLVVLAAVGEVSSTPTAFAMGRRPRRPPPPTIITGVVSDQTTNRGLPSASIQLLTPSGRLLAATISGRVGIYTLTVPTTGWMLVSASASGYSSQQSFQWIGAGRTTTVNFRLAAIRPNQPPRIVSLTPAPRATYVVGDTVTMTLTATDVDRDPLQYRFSLDGRVLREWSAAPTCTIKTTSAHHGRHRITAEVKDGKGGSASKTADCYIFRAFPKPGD